MSGYALHLGALIGIDEIAADIGEDSSEAPHRVVDEIYRAIQNVVSFPHRGHRRPDLTNRPMRFIRVPDYLIAMRRMKSRCG